MRNHLISFIPVIIIMGIIFFLSNQPGNSFDLPDIPNLDKVLHCIAYSVLAGSALVAVDPEYRASKPLHTSIAIIVFCLAYGISDEFHQSFTPGRCPSFFDIAADGTGAVLAVSTWRILRRKMKFYKGKIRQE